MYLQDFTREFGIGELIRFETEVVHVRLVAEEEGFKWKWKIKSKQRLRLRLRGKDENETVVEKEEIFDAVVVCIGHYTHPRVACIPGNSSATTFNSQFQLVKHVRRNIMT